MTEQIRKSKGEQHYRSLDEFMSEAYRFRTFSRYTFMYFCLGVANSSDAAEILCISYILADPKFQDQFLENKPWASGILAASVFLGMLIGGLLVGTLGDAYGRKYMLLYGLAINSTAGLVSAIAPNIAILAILRLISGLGIGATVPPLFTLGAELASPETRGFWVTFIASFWMVGSVYVALLAWLIQQHWRLVATVSAIPSALGCILVYIYVPESPRFLALQKAYSHAIRSIRQLASYMDYRGDTWSMQEILHHFPEDSERAVHTPNAWNEFLSSTSKLYHTSMLRTTIPLQLVWWTLSFGTYGLYTWINTLFYEVELRNVYFNTLLFALSNLPGNLLALFLMDWVGRNRLLVGSIIAAGFSLLGFAYVASYNRTNDDDLPKSLIVLAACSFQCFTVISWDAINVLTSERFPTTVRSTGTGLCAASGRIGAMFAQIINGFLVKSPVRLLLVAAFTLFIGAFTPSLLPDHDMTGLAVEDELVFTEARYEIV